MWIAVCWMGLKVKLQELRLVTQSVKVVKNQLFPHKEGLEHHRKSYGSSSSYVWMSELGHKES